MEEVEEDNDNSLFLHRILNQNYGSNDRNSNSNYGGNNGNGNPQQNKGIDESAHEFGALNTLLLVVILGLCILSAYLIKKYKFYYLPESAAAILVGLIVGGMARVFYPSNDELNFLSFQPEMFFFLLLPPIIFEAGYTLRRKHFFSNFWTIVTFAVIGTLISTFMIGGLTLMLGNLGIVNIDTDNPMEALMFGALISAVDPVATLSIIGSPELNCDPLLYSLVFGESVLNDAVCIVLFRTFGEFYASGEPFSASTLPSALGSFLAISLGSVVAGVAMGLSCSYLCKNTNLREYPKYEISLLFLFAYGSYAFAEAIALSGIMALFFCGIVLAHYNSYNLSQQSAVTAEYIFKSLAVMAEFFVFLFMGMGFFTGRFKNWDLIFIIFSIGSCLISRVFNTFPLSWLCNIGRTRKITHNMQIVIWFAGLRGAIAFALAQNMPGKNADLYTTTTLCICIFTTVVCGGLTEPVLDKFGMKLKPGHQSTMDDDFSPGYELVDGEDSPPRTGGGARRFKKSSQGLHGLWKQIDFFYLKPMFGGKLEDPNDIDGETQELITRSSPSKADNKSKMSIPDHETIDL